MKKLLILCGGRSDEHEISLISAKCVLDALDRSEFEPIVVGISKKGTWHWEEEKTFFLGEVRADRIRLNESAPAVTLAPYPSPSGRGRLECQGKGIEFDAVFPILHGPYGEDGTIQGLLDLVGVPYVGSHCGSSWICMDKVLAKTLAKDSGIRVADYVCLRSLDDLKPNLSRIETLGPTLFVKPSRLGSSVGVSKVSSRQELERAVELAFRYDSKVLIERGIQGRELECGVLGLSRSAKATLPGEIVVSPKIGWYSYEAKYLLKDGAETVAVAPLSPSIAQAAQELCLKAFSLFECDGMARIDLFLEHGSGELYLNEVNTIPGFTPISMYPKMWEAAGISYSDLITQLVQLAYQRLNRPY